MSEQAFKDLNDKLKEAEEYIEVLKEKIAQNQQELEIAKELLKGVSGLDEK